MTSKTFTFSASITAAIAAFFMAVSPVSAQSCSTQYGGTVTCPTSYVSINKQVWSPKESKWVENLDVDSAFTPADKVEKGKDDTSVMKFRIQVTNNNPDRTYNHDELTITDNFPYFVRMISGRGTVSGDSVSFLNPEDIKPGETKEFGFEFQVKPSKEIPGPTSVCMNNVASVTGAGIRGNEDKARVCFGDTAAKTLPVAGFNETALLIPFIALAASGLMLATRKNA